MKQHLSVNHKLIIVVAVVTAIIILVGIIFAVILLNKVSKKETVAKINGTEVSYGEFALLAEGLKSDVVTYFYTTHNVNEGIDFWDKDSDFGGEIPLEVLKKKTLSAAKEIKIEQELMVEYGVVSKYDTTFEAFTELLEQENKRRSDVIKSGGEVYGPEQYSASGYYQYLHSIRLQELREVIFEESGSENTEDRFSNELLQQLIDERTEKTEVETNNSVYEKIDSFS